MDITKRLGGSTIIVEESLDDPQFETPVERRVDTKSRKMREEERELASRLRATIDRNGRYSYRLDDMAAGFAAGRGLSPTEARKHIEGLFRATYACSPKEYTEQRFNQKFQSRDR